MKKRLAKKIYNYDQKRNFDPYPVDPEFDRYSKEQVRQAYFRLFTGMFRLRLKPIRLIEDNFLVNLDHIDNEHFLETVDDTIKWMAKIEQGLKDSTEPIELLLPEHRDVGRTAPTPEALDISRDEHLAHGSDVIQTTGVVEFKTRSPIAQSFASLRDLAKPPPLYSQLAEQEAMDRIRRQNFRDPKKYPITIGIDHGCGPERAHLAVCQKVDGVVHVLDFFEVTNVGVDCAEE